jgi:hypothetical protein
MAQPTASRSSFWKPVSVAALLVFRACAPPVTHGAEMKFTDTFGVGKTELSSIGTNRFFILAPGYQLVLEGNEDGKPTVLTVTVLKDTKVVDGVETRILEEREVAEGQVVEISRNYYAISKRTTDVFYFGEDSDTYKNGKVVSHEGSWRSGVGGAKFGLMMPGTALLGARYQQEDASKVAMDRAEIVSLSERLKTPAGTFDHCLKTEETSGIERGKEYKLYVAGIGLIQDGALRLTRHGFTATE